MDQRERAERISAERPPHKRSDIFKGDSQLVYRWLALDLHNLCTSSIAERNPLSASITYLGEAKADADLLADGVKLSVGHRAICRSNSPP